MACVSVPLPPIFILLIVFSNVFISTGFEIWIAENHFNTDYSQYRAKISFDDSTLPHERCMIVCMNPDHTYEVQFNGRPVKSKSYHTGVVEITLPNSNKTGVLTISALK